MSISLLSLESYIGMDNIDKHLYQDIPQSWSIPNMAFFLIEKHKTTEEGPFDFHRFDFVCLLIYLLK